MNITSVKASHYVFPEANIPKDIGTGSETIVVQVETDKGVSGLGSLPLVIGAAGPVGEAVCSIINRNLASRIAGEEARRIEHLWERMYNVAPASSGWGRRGLVLQAIAAVDVALWDIAGKAAGLPLWKLLGGYRDRVPAYASIIEDLPTEELAKRCAHYIEQGFKAVKVRCGAGVVTLPEAMERVRAVREAIGPHARMMVDINGTWDTATAVEMCKKWERYDLFWIEEPLAPDDVEGLVRLKQATRIPIATGEQLGTRHEFRELVERRCVDILQPDVMRVGGITEWVRVRGMASTFGYAMAPHGGLGIHMAAAFPEVILYDNVMPFSGARSSGQTLFRRAGPAPTVEHGFVPAPMAPGVGLELNEDAAKHYLAHPA